jgi:Uma2 family endonuclease
MPTTLSTSANTEFQLLTADDFLDWLEPGRRADLIDGEKYMHSPVSFRHARLVNFLDRLVAVWIERIGFGGELHREAVAVRLDSRTVVMPDLCWFDSEQVLRFAPAYAPFAPRWVAEALSPRTCDRDIGPKFASYETSGVLEYWILAPETLAHRFYRRDAAGEYLEEFAAGAEWINPDDLPSIDSCLAEIR